jgi:iron complex transport system permease protein
MNREKVKTAVLAVTFFFFLLVLFGCPFIGPTSISFENVFQSLATSTGNPDSQIFFTIRLSRNLLAALAGAALACAGVVFQAVLRNPLACPFTLGVASGSSFGAVVAILWGFTAAVWGFPVVTLFAFLGALLSLLLVYSLVAVLRSFSVTTLLLAGIAISFFFNALVLLAYHVADPSQSASMIHWLIGSLDMMELPAAGKLAAGIFVGFMLLLSLARELNLLSAGEELARVKGVPTYRVIVISILAASLMTSAVVALTGPIAFVGLIIPHIYRLFVGNDHRFLLPASTLGGAAFLMLCDTAARSFFGASELPVGVLTAILGVPVLLFLLFRRKTYVLN